VLGLFGAILLGSSALRFGNLAAVHGSFTRSEVQYASIFWGIEQPDSRRARAFSEHGQFNARRIPPNALVYFASPPSDLGMDRAIDGLDRLHARLIAPTDAVIINQPKVGVLFLWPAAVLLAVIGLAGGTVWRPPAVAGLAGVAIGSLMMLSYPTITLRYHIDLWPLVALPGVFGLERLSRGLREGDRRSAFLRSFLLVLLAAGCVVTVHKTVHSRFVNLDSGAEWTTDFCLQLTEKKGFGPARRRELCMPDSDETRYVGGGTGE
jgi:hypothetical protein